MNQNLGTLFRTRTWFYGPETSSAVRARPSPPECPYLYQNVHVFAKISLILYMCTRIPYRLKIERKEILNKSTIKINCRHLSPVEITFLLETTSLFMTSNDLQKFPSKNQTVFPTSNFFSSETILPAGSPSTSGGASAASCRPWCIARVQRTILSLVLFICCLEQTLKHTRIILTPLYKVSFY